MSFDYFYGQQSDLFTFYRVPKVLFTNERFWNISADAKMLYGILLDRMSLSAKNGWIDKNGRVYIIFTIDEAKMALNCAEQKAIKLLSELEKKAGLIERKRQGLGKPNLIYVKNFISAVDSQLLNCENHNSGTMEITTQELPKSQCNNTDIKNTEFSDTDSIFPSGNGGMMDENDRYQEYFDYFSDQLSIDLLKKDYPYDSEMLDNILELIVETVCTKRPLIRIGAEERPAEIVRSRFMKLNVEHIRYVMDCFKENTTKIRNIRQYMLTTIDQQDQNRVDAPEHQSGVCRDFPFFAAFVVKACDHEKIAQREKNADDIACEIGHKHKDRKEDNGYHDNDRSDSGNGFIYRIRSFPRAAVMPAQLPEASGLRSPCFRNS